MSFTWPIVLAGLVAIPALAVWYVYRQRGRVRDRAAFVSGPLMASVAPNQPRWRRHAPMVAFALALAVLIVAAARPQTTQAVAVDNSAIMLANDVSGSMAATDVKPSRLGAVEHAAKSFIRVVPKQVSVGLMVFDQNPTVLQSPTTDRAADRTAFAGVRPHGGTAIGSAIQTALRVLTSQPRVGGARPPAAMVLLSDGYSTSGPDPVAAARQAARDHIKIYTVALGTPNGTITAKRPKGGTVTEKVPPDPQALAQIAKASGGQAFTVQDSSRLTAVYRHLGAALTHKKVKRELTAGFVSGGLVLLMLGCLLSLRWFGRLI